jgi:peptide/nickel transport system permease protein
MAERTRRQGNRAGQFFRRLLQTPIVALALLILIGVVIMAIAAPRIAPYDPTYIDVVRRLKPPLWTSGEGEVHLLGTDSLGRDVFSRVVYGSRISLIVGLTVVIISGTFGVLLGLISGYAGGSLLDDVIMRLADIQLAFPFLLIAIAFLAVLGPGLVNVVIVLALFGWVQYARVVRGQTMALREKEFVEAARAIGVKHGRIIFRHILPNTWAPTIVLASFAVASTILTEAALSFLGLGVKPAVPTWGGMLADGRDHITVSWWIVLFPGLAIMITVLCINVFGDWLRDYLDPRLRV